MKQKQISDSTQNIYEKMRDEKMDKIVDATGKGLLEAVLAFPLAAIVVVVAGPIPGLITEVAEIALYHKIKNDYSSGRGLFRGMMEKAQKKAELQK